jgi:hypothetical protein
MSEARIRELRQEIAATERAQPPLEDVLVDEMARFDRATQQFGKEPYKRPFLGALSWERLEVVLMGMAGCLIDGSRQHYENHVRARLAAQHGMRLSEAEKTERLRQLAADLRLTEAHLEIERRRQEQQRGEVLPRADADPAIWLLHDDDLKLAAAGREIAA